MFVWRVCCYLRAAQIDSQERGNKSKIVTLQSKKSEQTTQQNTQRDNKRLLLVVEELDIWREQLKSKDVTTMIKKSCCLDN